MRGNLRVCPPILQIVWLRIDMNTGAVIKALLLDILEKIDDLPMGETNYAAQNSRSGIGVEKIINNTIRALKTHFCGMILLDEIQRLNFGQKNASERVPNFLLKLLNTGIPVVLVGNPLGLTNDRRCRPTILATYHRPHQQKVDTVVDYLYVIGAHFDFLGKVEGTDGQSNLL
jgi:hypothetical protein